ncbi:hypothetical protein GCM10027295_35260 [Pseudaeromonas pectinilytica]
MNKDWGTISANGSCLSAALSNIKTVVGSNYRSSTCNESPGVPHKAACYVTTAYSPISVSFDPIAGSGETYQCPPTGNPDYSVGPMDLNGQKVCYKRTCLSNNNWFSNSMELGTGTACSFGCKYTVTSSFQSNVGPNAFIAKGSGDTCSCSGSTQCWLDRKPNTEGDNDDTGTCYAWDLGQVKGVDCGKNGEMTVDLQPINDSLVALSQTNTAQDKTLNDHSVQLGNHQISINDIKSRLDSGALKGEKGDTGPAGPAGPQGEKGLQGGVGAAGAPGEAGATGPQGEKGEKGDKGDKGDTGEAGSSGAAGAAGRDGVDGQNGTDGAQGLQGIQGLQGEKGDTGEDGDSVLAVQDGIDVHMVNARTGARMATLEGIDKDGIITAVDESTSAIKDLTDTLNITAPTESENPFKDIFGDADISALEQQIVQAQTDFSTLVGQAGSRLNIGSVSGGGSYAADVHDIKGQQVDLSGGALFDMLVANGAATIVSLLFSLIGFGVLLGGNKK